MITIFCENLRSEGNALPKGRQPNFAQTIHEPTKALNRTQ